MTSVGFKKADASDMARELHNYPNITSFLEILLKDVRIQIKQTGSKFDYEPNIYTYKLYSQYGVFMDYFIRKVLSNQYKIKLRDENTQIILSDAATYFTKCVKSKNLLKEIQENYKIYIDPKCQAVDIVDAIKTVSLSTALFFGDALPKAEVKSNKANLLEIIKYFKTLDYSITEIKPDLKSQYYQGKADIIFDKRVMYEIKTSKFSSLSYSDKTVSIKKFYKLLLYAFGYYKKTGIIIKCFKIYNPLLGQEYAIELNDVDMLHFEEAIKGDVKIIE